MQYGRLGLVRGSIPPSFDSLNTLYMSYILGNFRFIFLLLSWLLSFLVIWLYNILVALLGLAALAVLVALVTLAALAALAALAVLLALLALLILLAFDPPEPQIIGKTQ